MQEDIRETEVWQETTNEVQEKTSDIVNWVKENPVKTAAIVVGAGLLVTGVVLAVRHGFSLEEELETVSETVEMVAEAA